MSAVKLDLTKKEYEQLYAAVSMFTKVAIDPRFYDLVRSIYHPMITNEQIGDNMIVPIINVPKTVHIPKNINVANGSKVTFFTEKLNATYESIALYDAVKHLYKSGDLHYDQVKDTCISDVKSMLYKYGKIDGFIRSLCPGLEITELDHKTSLAFAKYVTKWIPKNSRSSS